MLVSGGDVKVRKCMGAIGTGKWGGVLVSGGDVKVRKCMGAIGTGKWGRGAGKWG